MLAKLFWASGDRIWEENKVASDSETNEVWTWDARAVTPVTNYVTCHDKCDKTAAALWQCLGCQTSHDTLLRWHALSSDNILSLDAALTLGYYRLGCWRINSLLQRFYEHHSLRFQLNCVLFFRELIESLSPLWGFITRPEQGFVGWFLWQTPGWDVSLCHDCMRWGLTLPDRRGLLISWFNQSELGILTSINSDSWSV